MSHMQRPAQGLQNWRRWLASVSEKIMYRYHVQGVFFNWAHPEFAKCRPVSNRFQKNDRVPDWPPPHDEKKTKCLRTSMWFSYLQDLGGASRGIFGGGQSRDILRGGPVKKITLYYDTLAIHKMHYLQQKQMTFNCVQHGEQICRRPKEN